MPIRRFISLAFFLPILASCGPTKFSWSEEVKVGYGTNFFENGHHGYVTSPSIAIAVTPTCSKSEGSRCLSKLYINRFVANLNSVNDQIVAYNIEDMDAVRTAYRKANENAKNYCFSHSWKNRNDCKVLTVDMSFSVNRISKSYEFTYSSPDLGYAGDGTTTTTCSGIGNMATCTSRENQSLQVTGYSQQTGYGTLQALNFYADVEGSGDFISTDTYFLVDLNEISCNESRIIDYMIDNQMSLSSLIKPTDGKKSFVLGNDQICP